MTIEELMEALKVEKECSRSASKMRAAKYRFKHPDRFVETCRKSRKNRMAYILKYNATYAKAHPEMSLVYQQNRRARLKGSGEKLSKNIIESLMESQNGICNYCSVPLPKRGFHIDHILPLALGGPHNDNNVQLLCASCNLRKSAKHPDVFARQIGLKSTAKG